MNKLALNRLNLWQKLGALVLAQLVPAVLVGFFYFTTMDGELSQVRGELQGSPLPAGHTRPALEPVDARRPRVRLRKRRYRAAVPPYSPSSGKSTPRWAASKGSVTGWASSTELGTM